MPKIVSLKKAKREHRAKEVLDKEQALETDSGFLENLKYKVYGKWNTIHIYEGNKVFKKDCDRFEEAFEKINIEDLLNKKEVTIEGSGDNADLLVTTLNGEVSLRLKDKRGPKLARIKDKIAEVKKKTISHNK